MKKISIMALAMAFAGSLAAGAWEMDVNKAARLHKKGDLKGAEGILLNTLLQAEKFGESDARLAYTLDYLGTLNMQMNLPDKAAPMLERAVKAFSAAKGPKAEETLEAMGRLAETYDSRELYAKSEPLYRAIYDSGRGDAMAQSVDANNLAVSMDAQGRQDEALLLYKKALELREKSFGLEAAELPEILNNIARVYYMRSDFSGAEPLYERAIKIDEAMLKPGDAMLADDYRRLAALYKKTGREALSAEFEGKAEHVKAAAPAPAPSKPKLKKKKAT